MSKTKSLLSFLLLFSVSLLQAETKYEKEFISLVNTMVKDGNISSISKVACAKGDCRIDDLVMKNIDLETGAETVSSMQVFKVKDVKNFITFKEGKGRLKEGEKRAFALELEDIKSDGHNLFFDKEKMKEELGEKSVVYNYFKKHLDAPTDGTYRLTMHKKSGDVMMQDRGDLSTGSFAFGMNNHYTIKGGFEKLDELAQTNPMGVLSYVVINSIEINIKNPKGFLRNLMYITYKSEMQKAKNDEEKRIVNETALLEGSKLHTQKEFTKNVRKNVQKQIKEMAAADPEFAKLINADKQFEKKIDAILAGTSQSIQFKVENKHGLSLGDFFTIFMGYAMQQKLAIKPDIKVVIR